MTENSPRLHRKLKRAAYLLIAGLLLEAVTLNWADPISFLLFICLSGSLVMIGVMIYLLAIVSA